MSRTFSTPKIGRDPDHNDDRYWPRDHVSQHVTAFRFAVSDGASGSWHCGAWADALCRYYCRHGFIENVAQREVPGLARRLPIAADEGPWYARRSATDGAHAALAGLTLRDAGLFDEGDGTYQMFAYGDSGIFHIRGYSLIRAFPFERSTDFPARPHLIGSRVPHCCKCHATRINGTWQSGDEFLLMSDTIAQWFLEQFERRTKPLRDLRSLETTGNSQTFQEWITRLRDAGELKDDDVTITHVHVFV